jgi:hypothetical protein
MTRVLTVQTVIYGNDPEDLARSLTSLGCALVVARREGLVGEVTFAHGDASVSPLPGEVTERLRGIGERYGFAYEYQSFGENSGSARGQNRLAGAFPADWHLATNPDVVFGGTALARLWRRATDPAVGILEARQIPLELPKAYDPVTGETSWACAMCALVRGDLWRELGGYDEEHFFLYCDDVDMSWRARLGGHQVVHVPAARVFHDKRDTLGPAPVHPPHEIFYSALGSYMMAAKWGGPDELAAVRARIAGAPYVAARAEIDRLEAAGRVPDRLAGAERVAQFAPDGRFGSSRY